MRKTVKQISEELGISKPAVTQRMNAIKDFRAKYTKKVGNRLEINENGVHLIIVYGDKNHQFKTENSKQLNGKQLNNLYFMNQIEIKDKQINNLQKSLDKQQELLNQQQQLQLATVSENRELKEHVQKLSYLIEKPKENDNFSKKLYTNKSNRRWWHFW